MVHCSNKGGLSNGNEAKGKGYNSLLPFALASMLHISRARLGVLAFCTVAIAASIIGLTWNGKQRMATTAATVRAREAIDHTAIVLSLLTDAETGQRGYLLTEQEIYLRPYLSGVANFSQSLRNLRSLLSSDKEQSQRLQKVTELSNKKLAELATTVNLVQQNQKSKALTILLTGQGKRTMDLVRQELASIRQKEQLKVQRLTKISKTRNQQDQVFYGLGLASILLISCVLFDAVIQDRQGVESANAKLQELLEAKRVANAELEDSLELKKAANAELKQLLESREQLNNMVSHKLLTPLTTISSSAELIWIYYIPKIPEGTFTPKQRSRLIQLIEQHSAAIGQMKKLLDEILIVGRAQTLGFDFAPAHLNLLLVVEGIISVEDVSGVVQIEIVGEPRPVMADYQLLVYSLGNLLSNAIKYSPQGSPVSFVIEFQDQQVIFKIRDKGIGIPEEDRDRLFSPFERGSNTSGIQGTGLGLITVKKAVEAHNGKLEFISDPGNTEFIISLPI